VLISVQIIKMTRRRRLTRRERYPDLSVRYPIDSDFRSALRALENDQRRAADLVNYTNRLSRSRQPLIQIIVPPQIRDNRLNAPDIWLPADSIRTNRPTVEVNTVEELQNLIKRPDFNHKVCFKQSMIILAPTIYGEFLCKPALKNELVERHMSFFLGLNFHRTNNNNELTGFDPNGIHVTNARTNFEGENFHELFIPFSHRLIKRQDFIQTVKITEQFSEEKWLSNVSTIIHNLQMLDNYEKKNFMKFIQKDLPPNEKIQLEGTEIPITTSQNLIIDEFISPVKTALCHKIICFSCCQGFKNEFVSNF
jgi:hypothetical protein